MLWKAQSLPTVIQWFNEAADYFIMAKVTVKMKEKHHLQV